MPKKRAKIYKSMHLKNKYKLSKTIKKNSRALNNLNRWRQRLFAALQMAAFILN